MREKGLILHESSNHQVLWGETTWFLVHKFWKSLLQCAWLFYQVYESFISYQRLKTSGGKSSLEAILPPLHLLFILKMNIITTLLLRRGEKCKHVPVINVLVICPIILLAPLLTAWALYCLRHPISGTAELSKKESLLPKYSTNLVLRFHGFESHSSFKTNFLPAN